MPCLNGKNRLLVGWCCDVIVRFYLYTLSVKQISLTGTVKSWNEFNQDAFSKGQKQPKNTHKKSRYILSFWALKIEIFREQGVCASGMAENQQAVVSAFIQVRDRLVHRVKDSQPHVDLPKHPLSLFSCKTNCLKTCPTDKSRTGL